MIRAVLRSLIWAFLALVEVVDPLTTALGIAVCNGGHGLQGTTCVAPLWREGVAPIAGGR